MDKIVDVVVVGGGVIGSSVAYCLAKKGVRVIVVEKKEGLSFGASGANQGGCPLQLFESPVLELARESLKLYKNLSEEIGYDIEYENVGSLVCSVDEKQYPDMEKHVQNKRREGMNVRLMEGHELRKLEPTLGEDVVVGVEEWDSCTVNPFKVNYGLAYAARKLGTEFLFSSQVKKIETDKGRIASVITDREKIKTKFLVNAAGAWASEIGEMLGLTIPVRARRGQIIVTEPVPLNERWRYILDADYLTTAFDLAAIEKSKDARIKLGVAGSYIQEKSGNWTIGSSRDFAGYNNRVTMQTLKYMAKRAIKFVPKLKDISCIRTFAGLRPFCYVDGLPILSKIKSPQNFVIATGHAGKGMTLAPITGKLIAELITESRTSLSIDAFSFSRFKNIN
ncbi:Hydrogen cyanide synthase subunit HcnC [subsurface metagenome]